ncbi:MAG: hypothetical protein H0W66_05790 [Chthoniobacterales bacterium]|nr:hypothetical protein [Chthoniobacterales bacterium]
MTIPLNYRVVLAAFWLVTVGAWLALQVWPAEVRDQDPPGSVVTTIEEMTPSPTLVSENSSLIVDDRELTHHE